MVSIEMNKGKVISQENSGTEGEGDGVGEVDDKLGNGKDVTFDFKATTAPGPTLSGLRVVTQDAPM